MIFGVTIILNMKVKVIEIKHYQLKKILIIPYLKDITSYLKKLDTWNIQLTIEINFIFPRNDDKSM